MAVSILVVDVLYNVSGSKSGSGYCFSMLVLNTVKLVRTELYRFRIYSEVFLSPRKILYKTLKNFTVVTNSDITNLKIMRTDFETRRGE